MLPPDRTLAAIVDTFVPAADGLPSASELGVHRRLLEEVDALGKPALRRQLDLLLRALGTAAGTVALGGAGTPLHALADLDAASREAFMRRLADSPIGLKRTAFQDLKRLTLLLAYGIEDSPWRATTGYVAPVADPPDRSHVTVRTPRAGEALEADAVIIGSGPGGGVAAAVLAAAGRRVLVLEKAAMVWEDDFGGPELDGLGSLFLDRGLAATDDRWISIRAGSAVGGGSVINWSSSLRLPDAVRDEWRAAGVGDDLEGHYEAIEADMGVNSDESPQNGPNGRLAAGLDAMGLPWRTIPRNVRGCGDCGPCAVGCRRGAKQSTLRRSLAEACALGAEILDRTDVLRITVADGRATGVVARVPGGELTVRAPLVALAGGSILSPAVLQRSGIARGTAGASLHIHPVAAVIGIYPEPMAPWSGVPQSVMSDAYAEVAGAYGFRMEAAPTHPGLIATGFPWWGGDGHRRTLEQSDRIAAFLAIVKDRSTGRVIAQRDGSVTVKYQPGEQERALLRLASLELARVHRAAGADRVVPLVTPPLDWVRGEPFDGYLEALRARPIAPNRVLLFTAHQMSSNRIGLSPRTSVADPDGRVHGVRGLYVTDASAMPTASGVNPMLSLMALARRTATRMVAAS
jgi:choline dehydrogenase-like flavoprotein